MRYVTGIYAPGSLIPIVDERKLIEDQSGHALLFSRHVADHHIPKLSFLVFRGNFIVSCSEPRVVPGVPR